MKKTLILAVLISLFLHTAALAAPQPDVVADGALLIDMTTGEILYEKAKDTKFYPASTTKIMTALIALERLKLDDKIVVGKKPPFVIGSKIYVFEGEVLTVEQMLYALLIESANDVASVFAEHISGSDEAFGVLMTQRAKELGCTNTNFVNPHGLYDPEHYTTAYDLYLIAKEAMKHDFYRKVMATRVYTLEPTNKQPEKRYFHSNNRLMFNKQFLIEGANGAKTGYTTESGHSLVATAFREDTKLMTVLLHDKKPGLWEDAYALFNYGFNSYKTTLEVAAGTVITSLKMNGSAIEVPLIAENDLYYTRPVDTGEALAPNIEITEVNDGEIVKGQKVGYAEYTMKGLRVGTVNLLASRDLPATVLYNFKSDSSGSVKKIYSPYLLIPAAGFLVIGFMTVVLKIIKNKSKRSNI